jgi:hypothetical protein
LTRQSIPKGRGRLDSGCPVESRRVRLTFAQPLPDISSVVHEILGIRAAPEVFGGRADSHHSLRRDGAMAEKCEETIYKTSLSIVSDRLERAERVALGLSRRLRTGPPRIKSGHDEQVYAPFASVH